MSRPVRFRPQVRPEIRLIRDDYDKARDGLGDEFYAEFLKTLDRIEAHPYLYGVVSGRVRAAPLHRFPYVAYYQVKRDHSIILTVLHGRRSPRFWKRYS